MFCAVVVTSVATVLLGGVMVVDSISVVVGCGNDVWETLVVSRPSVDGVDVVDIGRFSGMVLVLTRDVVVSSHVVTERAVVDGWIVLVTVVVW